MTNRRRQTLRPATFTLHIISDATGSLAAHMINSVLTQFPKLTFKQVYHIFKRRKDEVENLIRAFRPGSTIVLHALLDPESKQAIAAACHRLTIPHYDLTGSLVQFIGDHLHVRPVNELARLHQIDSGYFKRIEAMEFTAQHDEGRRIDHLGHADLILIGLQGVSKSPTSTYLGSMGYKVANLSLDRKAGFPEQLTEKLRKKIMAYTVHPRWLHEIRRKESHPAGSLPSITREVIWAESEFLRRRYAILNITGLTVEAIAATTLKTLGSGRADLAYQ